MPAFYAHSLVGALLIDHSFEPRILSKTHRTKSNTLPKMINCAAY